MPTYSLNAKVALPELSLKLVGTIVGKAPDVIDVPDNFDFSFAVVSDAEIQELNKKYRNKNKPTDVLSFRYDDKSGEIIVSADRVREQAKDYGNSILDESAFMIVHGILHIMGWDHEKSDQEATEQRAYEQEILKLCGLNYVR